MTDAQHSWIEGEYVSQREDGGALIGMQIPAWSYADLKSASKASGLETIELLRKALDHYTEHWVGYRCPANEIDAELEPDREIYRGIDTWVMEVLAEELFEAPMLTVGVHLNGDQIADLYAVLDHKHQESSIDFVRSAILKLIEERKTAQHNTSSGDRGTEATS